MRSVYKNLVSFEQAVNSAMESIHQIEGSEKINLYHSVGRILASNVYAPRNNPPFNRATMDGYAVRSEDVKDAAQDRPVTLKITGESFIGEPRKSLSGKGNCFKISTGAIVPSGSDAVVKVESTTEREGQVDIFECVGPTENIAESGSDICSSELLLASGKELETHDIAVLASLGISEITVRRRLKVEVISTGNELISYDESYSEGRINDANGVVVSSELNTFQCVEARYSGIVKDNYDSIRAAIGDAVDKSDVVILSGGSSAGESDLVYKIIEEFDPGIVFHGVLVKPGLPTVLGKKGSKVIIGLPGFPVSALMIFRTIFLIPILRAAGSRRVPAKKTGKLGVNLRLDMGRQNLVPVSVSSREGLRIYPVTGLSGSITRFTSTSGFVSMPGNTKFLDAGESVEFISWANEISQGDNEFSGIFINEISDRYTKENNHWEYRRMLPRDSLKSLSNGDSDLAVFLATSDTDLKEYIRKEMGSDRYVLFQGKTTKLVVASKSKLPTTMPVESYVNPETRLSGPSLRFLKNVVSDRNILRNMIGSISTMITSYIALGLVEAAEEVANGSSGYCITSIDHSENRGLNSVEICDIIPVFVSVPEKMEKIEEFLELGNLERLA